MDLRWFTVPSFSSLYLEFPILGVVIGPSFEANQFFKFDPLLDRFEPLRVN